jgi:pimeloyl-CoA synthetase
VTNLPPEDRKASKKYKDDLTVLGEWFYELLDYLEIDAREIARRAGINISTISKGTRDIPDRRHMTGEIVLKIRDQIRLMLKEKGLSPDFDWERYFLNAAGYATQAQQQEAETALQEYRRRKEGHSKKHQRP